MVDDTPDDLVFELHNEALWGAHPVRLLDPRNARDRVARSASAICAALHDARLPSAAARRRRGSGNVEHDALLEVLERTAGSTARPASDGHPLVAPAPAERRARASHVRARQRADAHRRSARRPFRTAIRAATPWRPVSMLLGGGMSSRLFQRVREELGLAYAVYTFQSFHADIGHARRLRRHRAARRRRGAPTRSARELRRRRREWAAGRRAGGGQEQLKGQITLSLESVASRMYRAAPASSCTASRTGRSMRCSRWIDAVTRGRCRGSCARILSRPSARRWCVWARTDAESTRASARSSTSLETATHA